MPFDIYISRSSTFSVVSRAAPEPGLFGKLFSRREAGSAIALAELAALMAGAPATEKAEGLYWVVHPQEKDPWFVTEWQPAGHVLLSTSYSSHRFIRNAVDLLQQAVHIARGLKGFAFEEAGGRLVTEKTFPELLDPKGNYLALQARMWRQVRQQMGAEAMAPLEFPLGQIDLVSEYLVFNLFPEREIGLDAVKADLTRAIAGVKLAPATESGFVLVGADDGKGLAKVLHRPDGQWQVWPSYGEAPFERIAPRVVSAAERVHDLVGGEMKFNGRVYDEALAREVRERAGGLGVDFYRWTRAS